ESWLKLLSSKPPASETMQGLKPSTALDVASGAALVSEAPGVAVVVSSGASPHAASSSAAAAPTAAIWNVFFTEFSYSAVRAARPRFRADRAPSRGPCQGWTPIGLATVLSTKCRPGKPGPFSGLRYGVVTRRVTP